MNLCDLNCVKSHTLPLSGAPKECATDRLAWTKKNREFYIDLLSIGKGLSNVNKVTWWIWIIGGLEYMVAIYEAI